MKILIKGGTVVNHDISQEADILVEDGKIVNIEKDINDESANIISAEGCYILPGGVDLETYFGVERAGVRSPEDYFSGTKAAIFGGTTTVVNCLEVTKDQSLRERFQIESDLATKDIVCNLAFQVLLPNFDAKNESEFKELLDSNSVVPVMKLSTCNKGSHLVKMEDDQLYDALVWCRDHGVLPTIHAENDTLVTSLEKSVLQRGQTGPEGHYWSRIEDVEKEAIGRVLSIAEMTKCPVHFDKVYSEEAVHLIREKRSSSSVSVQCATSVVSLVHTARRYMDPSWEVAAAHVTLPALKMNDIREDGTTSLMDLVAVDWIDHVVSSHLVFGTKHKASGKDDFRFIIPGTSGVQYRMKILWEKAVKSGKMDPSRFVNCTSTAAAKIANLYPQKGCLSVGSDADLVVWSNDGVACEHVEAGDVNIYAGIELSCGPRVVLVNGTVVLSDGVQLVAARGAGRLLCPVRGVDARFLRAAVLTKVQNGRERKVVREPYTGPVYEAGKENEGDKVVLYSDMVDKDVYSREGPKEDRKEALPPGQRTIRTSVKTAQPPGGASQPSWWN